MKKICVLAVAAALASGVAVAQDPYLTGSLTNPNWQPGTGVSIGDGSSVALTESGGVYSLTLTAAQHGLLEATNYEWKIAGPGFANPELPSSNAKMRIPVGYTDPITWTWDSNTYDDGFVPSTDIIFVDVATAQVEAATRIALVGDFQSENGGTDWTPSDNTSDVELTDAGNGTIGDGIYEGTVTGLPAGNYSGGIVLNSSFDEAEFKRGGLGGDNISFDVLDPTSVITVTLDANTGRHRVTDSNANATPGVAYARSSAWTLFYDATTDMGAATDNVYSKDFVVATPGEYTVQVNLDDLTIPSTGLGIPFITTTPNETVTVNFDRRIHADGFSPEGNIVTVLTASDVPTSTWTRVQAVGNFMKTMGGGSIWNNDDSNFNLSDQGNGIWTASFTALADHDEGTDGVPQGKALGITGNLTPGSDNWYYQFGGEGNGLVAQGNAPNFDIAPDLALNDVLHIAVDTWTGRIAYSVNSAPGAPLRGTYISGGSFSGPGTITDVSDWMFY